MEANKKPAARVTVYPITATVWKNQGRDGEVYFSTAFEKRYRDREGKWAGTQNYNSDDLLVLAKVADLAHSEILRLKSADRKTRQQEEEPAAEETAAA